MSDYINPMQSFQQGLGFGTQLQNLQTQRQQQQLAIQQAQQQLQNQEAMQQLYNKIQTEGATAQDYANLASMLPEEQAKPVREAFNLLTESQQRESLNDSGQIYSALRSGNTQIAVDLMQDMKRAYDNAGDQQGSRVIGDLLSTIQAGDDGARLVESYFGNTLALVPGGMDVIENANLLSEEARKQELQPGVIKQQAADLGLTQAQTNKIIADTTQTTQKTAQTVLELERLQQQGGLTDKEKSDKENTLRKEFNTLVGDFDDVSVTLDNIATSAQDSSGAGDVALVTAFMKMLDPGSVVRETEFATARDTAGLYGSLQTILPKVQKGEFLTDGQRKSFERLANQYFNSYKKRTDKYIDQYGNIADRYGINRENILRPTEGTTQEMVELTGFKDFIVKNNPGVTAEQLQGLSEDQLKIQYPKGAAAYFGQQETPTVNPTTGNPIRTGSFE